MDTLSERNNIPDTSCLPEWDKATTRQRLEICKMKYQDFLGFIPVMPFILHLLIVVHISSDCSRHNNVITLIYLVSLHIFTFCCEFIYYYPFNSSWAGVSLRHLLFKLFMLMYNLFAFTLIRAKPYKCLVDFSATIGMVLFLIGMVITLVFVYKIDRKTKTSEPTFLNLP